MTSLFDNAVPTKFPDCAPMIAYKGQELVWSAYFRDSDDNVIDLANHKFTIEALRGENSFFVYEGETLSAGDTQATLIVPISIVDNIPVGQARVKIRVLTSSGITRLLFSDVLVVTNDV